MNVNSTNFRIDSKLFPVFFVTVWSVAQLAVFWFEWYRLLVFANVALFVLIAMMGAFRKSQVPINWRLWISFLAIYIYFVISTRWTPVPEESNEQALRVLASALPAFIAGDFLARKYKIDGIIYALCAIPIFYFIQAAYNLYFNYDIALIGNFSIRSVGGTALSIVMPACFVMYLYHRKYYYLIAFIICVILILLLQTRTGLIVGFLSVLITLYIYNKKLALNSALLFFPLLAFLIVLFPEQLFSRLLSADTDFNIGDTVLNELGVDRSLRVDFDRRLHTYMANRMFTESPLFGGGYYSLFQNNKYEFGIEVGAHGYPGTFAETGLIGIALFFNYLITSWRRAKAAMFSEGLAHSNAADIALLVTFATSLAVGFFHQIFESAFCALLAGILAGRSAQARKELSPARARLAPAGPAAL